MSTKGMLEWYNYLIKRGSNLAVVLALICILAFGLGIWIQDRSSAVGLTELSTSGSNASHFDVGIYAAILLLIVAFVLLIAGIVWDVFRNFKTGTKTLYILGLVLLMFIVLYLVSSADSGGRLSEYWGPKFKITNHISKYISSGIIGAFALLIASFAAIVYFELKSTIKNRH